MKVFLIYLQFRIGCISNSKTRQNLAGTSSCKKNGCGKVCCILFNPTIFGLMIGNKEKDGNLGKNGLEWDYSRL